MTGTGSTRRREGPYEESARAVSRALRARMVRRIVAGGGLTDPAWRAAFEDVPRHLFVLDDPADTAGAAADVPDGVDVADFGSGVPELIGPVGPSGRPGHGGQGRRRTLRRLADAYADRPIAIRVVGGALVSSSSQPSLMALMCEALGVRDGDRVLEVGAGTGYHAALLAHRLGPGAVTTVDLEPEITAAARAHLDAYGTEAARSVAVVTGDGALGHPPRAPYDRIVATCDLPSIPPAWLEQCVPGGRVLAPIADGLAVLTVRGPGRAEGRFLPAPAYFVPLRGAHAAARPADGSQTAASPSSPPSPSSFFEDGLPGGRGCYGLTVEGDRQWLWRDDPAGPATWPLVP